MELSVDQDFDALTLTVTATFDHPVEKVWDLYADPRKLERWWGPPGAPATVVEHDLRPGGMVHYFMTIEGDQEHHGRWDVESVDAPNGFVVLDRFAHPDGSPSDDMPATTMAYTFTPTDTGTQMVCVAQYTSREGLEQVLAMGVVDGLKGSMSQMDAILLGES